MKYNCNKKNKYKVLSLLLIVGLLIRIMAVIFLPQPAPDTQRYDNTALNLNLGRGFSSNGVEPTADSPPVYPLFLSLIYKLWGHNFTLVRIIQAVIDTITCLFIYLLTIKLFKREKIAFLALIISVFYPTLIASTTFILTETLYTFILSASILFMVLSMSNESWWWDFSAGVILGIATLCRPITLLFPFFLICSMLFTRNFKKIMGSIIMCLMMIITISPLTIRNYLVFDRFLPVSIGSGGNLWLGSYIPWNADYRYQDLVDKEKIEEGLSPLEADDKLKEEAIKNIKGYPFSYLKLCIKKFWRFWFLIPGSKEILKGKIVLRITAHTLYLSILFFSIIGLSLVRKQMGIVVLPPLLMIFYFTLFHCLLFVIPRYRLPIMPLIIMFASFGFFQLWKNLRA